MVAASLALLSAAYTAAGAAFRADRALIAAISGFERGHHRAHGVFSDKVDLVIAARLPRDVEADDLADRFEHATVHLMDGGQVWRARIGTTTVTHRAGQTPPLADETQFV